MPVRGWTLFAATINTLGITQSASSGEGRVAEAKLHGYVASGLQHEDLLSHATQALHDLGHRTVAVTVSNGNAAAIALYLSRGFRRLSDPTGND